MSKTIIGLLAGGIAAFAASFGINFVLAYNGVDPGGITTWTIALPVGMAVAAIVTNLAGRKKVTMADAETRRAALAMSPPAGMGMVVVFREGFMGKRNGIDLTLDGREMTQLLSPQFTAINVAPGQHSLNATLAGEMNAGARQGDATFDVAAGQAIVFRITLKMGLATGHVEMERIADPAPVMGKVAKMKMVLSPA